MAKPQIFIAMHYLEIGGAEAALIGLLNAIDYNKVDVDLFLYSHQGEFMRHIPKRVSLLPEIKEYSMLEAPMKDALLNGCVGVVAGRLKAKYFFNRYKRKNNPTDGNAIYGYIGKYVTPYLPNINDKNYDLAISFLTPHNIVLEKVKAKKKVCWIHTDYTRIDTDVKIELPVWERYDHIVSISPAVTETFSIIFPSLCDKIVEIENIIAESIVNKRATEFLPSEIQNNSFNILSIGRFTYPKNFDNIPDICSQVMKFADRKDIRWYIIGFGGDEPLIRQRIAEANMEKQVIIIGKKENPYPYIKACDLYAQPSRYEGKSVTVREAQMLGKPVVITNYPTASSQVENGIDGIIVPSNNTDCARGIASVINDKKLREQLSRNVLNRDYSNKSEVNKFYSMI